jgi:RimJ/RimL family protein N-acetyltransferase
MTDLVVRPLRAGEADLFLSMRDSMRDPDLVGPAWVGRDYRAFLAGRQYRPEWTWVAMRGDRVVARAAWWGGPGDEAPLSLDWFDVAEGSTDAGAALIRAAPFDCEYCLIAPPGWRELPAVRRAAEARIAAAERAGMRPMVERLHYTWTPADGLPERPGRLRYTEVPDDEAMLDLLRRIHVGTLDAHARRDLARLGADGAAREELAVLNWFPAPRDWWRLASTRSGELVGITVPTRNLTVPVIGLVGVVPEQRGNHYAYDLLVEATNLLVERGADQIVADTDTTNLPMAATFARAGYPVTQERVFLE